MKISIEFTCNVLNLSSPCIFHCRGNRNISTDEESAPAAILAGFVLQLKKIKRADVASYYWFRLVVIEI